MASVLDDISHRRFNPLRGSYVLVSPHRTKRPWQYVSFLFFSELLLTQEKKRGQQESPSKTTLPSYDPACYLCPGNTRAQGDANPPYKNTFVFVNDYSAVKEEQAGTALTVTVPFPSSKSVECAANTERRE